MLYKKNEMEDLWKSEGIYKVINRVIILSLAEFGENR